MSSYQWQPEAFQTPLQRKLQYAIRRLYSLKKQHKKAAWRHSYSNGSGFVVKQLESSIESFEKKIIRLEKEVYLEQQKLEKWNSKESERREVA